MKQYAFASGSPIRRALLLHALLLGVPPLLVAASAEAAAPNVPASSKAVKDEDGKYLDAKGVPTYKIGPDGKVDWYTFSGFRRFNGTWRPASHEDKPSGRRGLKRAAWAFEADLTSRLRPRSKRDFERPEYPLLILVAQILKPLYRSRDRLIACAAARQRHMNLLVSIFHRRGADRAAHMTDG